MSNFLQRVAAAAIQPPARLHPILGSIFASSTLRSPKDFSRTEVEIATQTLAPHRHEPVADPSFDASDRTGRDRLSPATAPEDFSQTNSPRSFNADPPLLPDFNSISEPRTPTPVHPLSEASAPTINAATPTAVHLSTSHDAEIAAIQQPASKPSPYQPLIAAMQQTAPRLHPHEPFTALAAIRASRIEAARRTQPAQREPDEVYIHIGRIEVAAVPQQTARPAATAARRSINLSDYLARNGRSG